MDYGFNHADYGFNLVGKDRINYPLSIYFVFRPMRLILDKSLEKKQSLFCLHLVKKFLSLLSQRRQVGEIHNSIFVARAWMSAFHIKKCFILKYFIKDGRINSSCTSSIMLT